MKRGRTSELAGFRYGRMACILLALVYPAMAVSILTSLDDAVDGVVLSAAFLLIEAGQLVVSQRCRWF